MPSMHKFNRMPRMRTPLPRDEVKLPAPPAVTGPAPPPWVQLLLPLAGVAVMIGVYGGLRRDWALGLPMLAISGTSVLTSIAGALARRRAHRRRAEQIADAYAEALAAKRSQLECLRQEQQRILREIDPSLDCLLERVCALSPRLWERRPEDDDFLCLRLGLGCLPSSVSVSAPHPDMPDVRLEEAHALEKEYAMVPDVPVRANLRAGPLGLVGPLAERSALARALICNLMVHHSPTEVHLLHVSLSGGADECVWLTWAPHTHTLGGAAGERCLAGDIDSAERLLSDLLKELRRRQMDAMAERTLQWPWLVLLSEAEDLVLDHPALHLLLSPAARELCATAILLVERTAQVPAGCGSIAELTPEGDLVYRAVGLEETPLRCRQDLAPLEQSARLARSLAPIRPRSLAGDTELPASVRLLSLMGIDDVSTHDVPAAWIRTRQSGRVCVPIGKRRGGDALELDLAHTGHGPHGLVAGTTGSGKSELLRSLVVALALKHHPHDLGLVLVDFKGGGAFLPLAGLPHVQGLVTDISPGLAERALVALRAELDRRKRLFEAAGVDDIEPYQRAYWAGAVGEPLPRLVVIVDEFAELVGEYPEFMDGLIGVARVGRSLGVHLLLATQSPAGVVKQQIWANARFRICLRVESRQESMDMLRRPEAAGLPNIPGRAYLQVGNDEVFELFQVAQISGQGLPVEGGVPDGERVLITEVLPQGGRRVLFDSGGGEQALPSQDSDVELVARRLAEVAGDLRLERLPSPWPDPLPDHVTLPDLLTELGWGGWDGEGWDIWERRVWGEAVVGLLDDPARQIQAPLRVELAQQDGHLILVGMPGAGKRMWLRTFVVSLARTHTPDECVFYLLDLGGQGVGILDGLPHVGGVYTAADDERVVRLFRWLLTALDERRSLLQAAGFDSLMQMRQLGERTPPAVVLIVSGMAEFRSLFPDELGNLMRVVRDGGSRGLHAVMAGDRGGDIPVALNSLVARRFALCLAEPDGYQMVLGSRVRVALQEMPRGRGWFGRPPREFQTASPGIAGGERDLLAELRTLAVKMDRAWCGGRPAPIGVLPAQVSLEDLLQTVSSDREATGLAVPLALDSRTLSAAVVDLQADGPDFVVAGAPQSGKTSLLRTWLLALAELYSPQEVRFVLVSCRRDELAPLGALPHVLRSFRPNDPLDLDWLTEAIEGRDEALNPSLAVFIDDYEEYSAGSAAQESLLAVARGSRSSGVHIIATGSLPDMGGTIFRDPLVRQIRTSRSGFLLGMLDPGDQNPLGVRLARGEVGMGFLGRGYVVRNGVSRVVQLAHPGDAAEVDGRVERLLLQWPL